MYTHNLQVSFGQSEIASFCTSDFSSAVAISATDDQKLTVFISAAWHDG